MNESQYPGQNPGQHPSQQPPKDPYGGGKPSDPSQKPPQKDPCDDPNPTPPEQPEKPKQPEPPPCPPPEPKCPEKKPCPELPPPPKDPCAPQGDEKEATEGGGAGEAGQQGPAQGSSSGTPTTGGTGPTGGEQKPADPIAAQLDSLKKDLKTRQEQILKLEPLKASIGDITQRIQALEKMLDGQAGAATSYKEFFRSIEVSKSEIDCFIPTVRCQLELTAAQKQCICDAIKAVDDRVNAAKAASDAANQAVATAERTYKKAADRLTWIKQWYEFLKTGLQQQVSKQRDDLKTLKGLADPSKNPCEAWFYLYELERLTKSAYGADGACWRSDINVATFLECWRWDCYEQVWKQTVTIFNEAEADEKTRKIELDQAKKNAADLDKLAREAESKRREWILKEIKTRDCCGPLSKCPEPKPGQGSGQGQGQGPGQGQGQGQGRAV